MIYIFGCSMCKWHWPTWANWLSAYGYQIKNLAYTGYGSENIYWSLINHIDDLTPDDEVIISWPSNHRIMQWYDKEWISSRDVWGFFPNREGKLWYTEEEPWLGLYRTHPDYLFSFSHGVIENLKHIHHAQLLLDSKNIKYKMAFPQNLWINASPKYEPTFRSTFQDKNKVSEKEKVLANNIMLLAPISNLMKKINWDRFIDVDDPFDAEKCLGIWEYFISKKEYIIYKHDTDQHPCPLAHHDYALEKILEIDPESGSLRDLAKRISEDCMSMDIPQINFIGKAEEELLLPRFKEMIGIK